MKGFHNPGNTCYFNTSLQCLLHIPCLSNYFIDHDYTGPCEFTKVYAHLTRLFWKVNDTRVMDISLLRKLFQAKFPRFVNDEQHDIQETVLCIIDILEQSVPCIKQWFYGKKIQQTIWPGGKSERHEDFGMHLLCSHGTSMEDMLKDSMKWNPLTDFIDDDGRVHHIATTRYIFSELPKVLMISFDKKSHIDVSDTLFINQFEYTLVASGIHIGVQGGGHYIAFTKHKRTWYYKNDDVVAKQALPIRAGHYLLVYNLKTPSSQYSP